MARHFIGVDRSRSILYEAIARPNNKRNGHYTSKIARHKAISSLMVLWFKNGY